MGGGEVVSDDGPDLVLVPTVAVDIPGPHLLPQGEQQRVAVEGQMLLGGDTATIVVIRDPTGGWVVYMECDPRRAVRVPDQAVAVAMTTVHRWREQGR